MTNEQFEVVIRRQADGAVLELSGTVTRASKEKMDQAYEEAAVDRTRVNLDFSKVDYINSTGIAVIVGLLARARAEERQIGAFGLKEHYRKVFQITRLADFMTIYDDETTATVG